MALGGSSYWTDPDFKFNLVVFLCRDRNFLRECSHLLTADDFKPRHEEPPELWIIASSALQFWYKYREPIGAMLRVEMLDYARQSRLSERQRKELLNVVSRLQKNGLPIAADAMAEKVISYKKERLKATAVGELLAFQERGQLTDEKWLEICNRGVEQFGQLTHPTENYFEKLEDRIQRRFVTQNRRRFPLLMIDPLDELIRVVARGHLGLWLAFLKMGKSLALEWTALAYILQSLNVLYFTLEDPLAEVEDRLDASISSLPIKRLTEVPQSLRIRFVRFTRLIRARLRIVDGTEGGMSVRRMEEIWERERNRGFAADVVLIDYDDEIQPPKKHTGDSARRMEFADIYRDLRQMAARHSLIVWTAAQTGRKSEAKKYITAGMVAEDISKVRKSFCTIGIGQGDWGDLSRYLYVVAHKFDQQHVGCNIVSDPTRGIFYDREATFRRLVEVSSGTDQEDEHSS